MRQLQWGEEGEARDLEGPQNHIMGQRLGKERVQIEEGRERTILFLTIGYLQKGETAEAHWGGDLSPGMISGEEGVGTRGKPGNGVKFHGNRDRVIKI